MMKRLFVLLAIVIALPVNAEVFYDIDFESPLHIVGSAPTTGTGTQTPSSIKFGEPLVKQNFGSMNSQCLVFNQTSSTYDQIRLELGNDQDFYFLSFDISTRNLSDSLSSFDILFDTPQVRAFSFSGIGKVTVYHPYEFVYKYANDYNDDTLMHVTAEIDLNQNTWAINVNEQLTAYGNNFIDGDDDIESIRFSLSPRIGGISHEPDVYVAIDNLYISNAVPEPVIPIADAGMDVELSADDQCGASVVLDGSGSSDEDGDELSYYWFYNDELFAEGVEVPVDLGLGEHAFTLIVNDGFEDSEPNSCVVTVIDDTLPELTISVDKPILWPANNKMVKITPSFEVFDNCSGEVAIELVDITCDQESQNDMEITDDGIFLRAKRDASDKEGRIYTLTYKATDNSDNETIASVEVKVPHDLGRRR